MPTGFGLIDKTYSKSIFILIFTFLSACSEDPVPVDLNLNPGCEKTAPLFFASRVFDEQKCWNVGKGFLNFSDNIFGNYLLPDQDSMIVYRTGIQQDPVINLSIEESRERIVESIRITSLVVSYNDNTIENPLSLFQVGKQNLSVWWEGFHLNYTISKVGKFGTIWQLQYNAWGDQPDNALSITNVEVIRRESPWEIEVSFLINCNLYDINTGELAGTIENGEMRSILKERVELF